MAVSPARHTYRYRPGARAAVACVACVAAGDVLLSTGHGALRDLAGLVLAGGALFSAEKMGRTARTAWRPPAAGQPLLDPDPEPREPPVPPATAAGRRSSEIAGTHGEP